MASLSLNIDERSLAAGKAQVRIRISHMHTSAQIPTGVYVLPKYFIGELDYPISSKAKDCDKERIDIEKVVIKYKGVINELEDSGKIKAMSASDIKAYAEGIKKERTRTRENHTFMSFFGQYGEERKSVNTRRSFDYTRRVLAEFLTEKEIQVDVPFDMVDYMFLKDFQRWLTHTGRGDCMQYNTFSYMKSVFYEAERCRLVSHDDNPFVQFRFSRPEYNEDIEYLSVDGIRRLLSLDFTNQQGVASMEKSRDIFMISFYLCGMNLLDIYNLPKQDGDEVVYVRSKIKDKNPRPVHIHIQPELRVLIDKYAGKTHLFNFAESCSTYTTFARNNARRFERISHFVGENVSMAICRRTWATYCGENGINDAVIDKSLGHKDSGVLRVHYKSYDWKQTDDANRTVIDYAFEGVVKNSIKLPKIIK